MSRALIEFSLRVLTARAKCLTDGLPRRLKDTLAVAVGCSSATRQPVSIHRQRATYQSYDRGISSDNRRVFSTSILPQLKQFPDRDHDPLKNPVEPQQSEDPPDNWMVDFPATGFADDAVNSLASSSKISMEEEEGRRSGEGFWKYGQPRRCETVTNRRNYVVCYDYNMKIPVWVAECLTYECLTGPANRRHSRYLPDLSVKVKARASNDDYRHNAGSLSRGHMAAAANNKYDQESMDETFLLSNVLPQDRIINCGPWNHLERLVRRLTDHYEEIRVISGPLILPSESNKGRVFVRYELIGDSRVVVPTHLFKVVLAEGIRGHQRLSADQRNPLLLAFVVPNSSRDLETSADGLEGFLRLERFLATLEFVEEKSGFEFFPLMDRNEILLQPDELIKVLQRISI